MPVAVPINPGQLIEQARDLAHHQSGAGRPRALWLRRAVSAAYYGVFHAVAASLTAQMLPSGTQQERLRLGRSLEHMALKDVCQWVTGKPGAGKTHVQPIVAALQADADIRQLADIVFRLQEARHLADYDHLSAFGKASVLTLINEAEFDINQLTVLVGTPSLEQFLALVALHSKLR